MAKCIQCGNNLAAGDRFCKVCGQKIGPADASRRRRGREAPRKSWSSPVVLIAGAGLVLLAVALALALGGREPTANPVASDIPYPNVPRISLAEAKAEFDAGSALFLDVRTADEYASSHVRGARLLPLNELAMRYQELPRDVEIITLCA